MDSTDDTVPHHETPSLGNPDVPAEGEVNTLRHPQSTQMTGPQNPAVASQFPNQIDAPGTVASPKPGPSWDQASDPMRPRRSPSTARISGVSSCATSSWRSPSTSA